MKSKVDEAYERLLRAIAEEEGEVTSSEVDTLYEQYKGKKPVKDVFITRKRITLLEIFNIVNGTSYHHIEDAQLHSRNEKKKVLDELVEVSNPVQLKNAIFEALKNEDSPEEREMLLEILKKL